MFRGFVEAMGELVDRKPTTGGLRLRIETPLAPEMKPGDSLAVNGVWLTVIQAESLEIHADVGPETIRVTTLGTIEHGSPVNLERALRADSRLPRPLLHGPGDDSANADPLRADSDAH